jgi:hypothetical protein
VPLDEIFPQKSVVMDRKSVRHGNRLLIARSALALFILGPSLPVAMSLLGYPMYASPGSIQLVAFVSLSSEFIAIALGFIGRHHFSGKVALIGAFIILVFVCLLPGFNHFRRVDLRNRLEHGDRDGSGEDFGSTGPGGSGEEVR